MRTQYERSFSARNELESSALCGCFGCEQIYDPKLIEEWVNDRGGDTAICPKCGIDSVVPYDVQLDISQELFLEKLKEWHKWSFT